MLKRSLKIKVMAAMFSAAFCIGGYGISEAYTYSGVTSTVGKVAEDENELVMTGGSKITSNGNMNPQKIKTTTNNISVPAHYESTGYIEFFAGCHHIKSPSIKLPLKPTLAQREEFNEIISGSVMSGSSLLVYGGNVSFSRYLGTNASANFQLDSTGQIESITINCPNGDDFKKIKLVVGADGLFKSMQIDGDDASSLNGSIPSSAPGTDPTVNLYPGKEYKPASTKTETVTQKLGDSSITVTNASTLIGKNNIQTSKSINVNSTSILSAAGTISGDTIASDGDIVAASGYSAPSGKSTITAPTITATGALTASKDIKATTGAISATVINTTGGNIVANNFIKSTGKVKGNALNVGVINASSASITGNSSIAGVFTTGVQAKLNGGAALGGKKITGLSIGTLSTTSTDAVNGKQLYTAIQSSGKTYTAGSDISISSANAISVAKAGKVAYGDTGIIAGDAVYQETNKIDNVLKAHNTAITSNNSKLDNLTTSIESLRKSLGTINSSVSDAISGLPGSLSNFANKDLTDLSDTGINTLKSYIKSEIKKQISSNSKTASYAMEAAVDKDTSAIDNVIASKANASDLTTIGSKVDSKADKADVALLGDTINSKADLAYVNDSLAKKAEQSVVEAVSGDVAKNTSAISKNTALIQANTEAISGLKDSKADVSGSNIDVSAWSGKLGTGTVAKDDTSLVTGSNIASAVDKKADIAYVAIGLGAMENGLDQMSQSVTKDVSRVGAGASALMGLHPTGDKFEFATAYGHYKNSNNTALGVFYKPTANSTLSMAGTIGDGDAMVSAGVSIKLGLNKEVKKVITPNEFAVMKSAVDSQDEKLDQIESALRLLMTK